MTVQAMKARAIEFLTKPFRDQDLLDVVNAGLARDRERRETEATVSALHARFLPGCIVFGSFFARSWHSASRGFDPYIRSEADRTIQNYLYPQR